MSKTPGQVVYENFNAFKGNAIGWPLAMGHAVDEMNAWEAAANAIIEECAKVAEADDSFMMLQDWGLQNAVTQKGENIAQAIRALKSARQEGSNG